MFKKTLIALAVTALAGAATASMAEDAVKTTVIHPITADSKVVVKKKTVVRHPGAAVVVHKKKVVHHPMTGTKVVHRATVIKTPTSKTKIVHPAMVKSDKL